jgi:outer membrane lipoprotein-sorting protein
MIALPRTFVIAAAFVLLCANRVPAAEEWGLRPLMNALRQVRSSTARFVETKYLHLLNQAQKSSGRLIYVAPDQLQKETLEPVAARLTINGDRLTIERQGERTQSISLRDNSEIGALVESVRATLAGDELALTRHFAVTLAGDANGWTLVLAPKEARLRELVNTIRIQGEHAVLRRIETIEADGDRTDMVISPDSK